MALTEIIGLYNMIWMYRGNEYSTTTTISVLNHHVEFVDETSKLQLGSVCLNTNDYIIEDIFVQKNG